MTDDADVPPPPAACTVRPNGRPTGRSYKWANVSVRPRSSRSKSPPPLFDAEPACCRTDTQGQAERSLNASASAPTRRATPSPVPPGGALPALVRPQPKRQCRGIYDGRFGAALQFAGRAMLNTGRLLLEWSREHDAGVTSFA